MPPLTPLKVISSPEFLQLGLLSLVVMMLVGSFDAIISKRGSSALRLADVVDAQVGPWLPLLLRFGLAAFFCVAVVYFGASPVFLTPELHTSAVWVPLLQIAIALSMVRRHTAWLGALGIGALYASAVFRYGWFHLLDYPVFLAAAAFVAIDSLWIGRYNHVGFAVLRFGAGITLMWAGAEKWLYPWWSQDVLNNQLQKARGDLSPAFFMAAAGWVEFCAAYALVFGRLTAQLSAWVLLVPFIAAIPLFGTLDAIGHAPIIIVLLTLGLTRTTMSPQVQGAGEAAQPSARGMTCMLAGLASVGIYWTLQALAYRRDSGIDAQMLMVATLSVLPLFVWELRRLPVTLRPWHGTSSSWSSQVLETD